MTSLDQLHSSSRSSFAGKISAGNEIALMRINSVCRQLQERGETIGGLKVYPDMANLPQSPDLAVICHAIRDRAVLLAMIDSTASAVRWRSGPPMLRSVLMSQSLAVEFALRHCEMMRLVPRAASEQADEPETTNVLDFFWVGRGDGQEFAVRQFGRLGAPSVVAVRRLNPGRDHPLDGDERAPAAGDRDLQSAVDLLGRGLGVQRDLVHVNQMLAQRFEIDLRPVGLRVGIEVTDDLLYG